MTINAWGTDGREQFALPMRRAIPDDPTSQEYVLQWSIADQLLKYVPNANNNPAVGTYTPLATYPGGTLGAALKQQGTSLDALLGSNGASISYYRSSKAGAVSRLMQEKFEETVSVYDYGAKGDWNGTTGTDDTTAFTLACAALGSRGGTVKYAGKHLINSALTIPKNVTLQGSMGLVGSPGNNASAPYQDLAALIVNPANTIQLLSGAGHDGGLLYRKGQVFPTTDAAAFAGTCFTAAGDDTFCTNSMVLGFNLALFSNGFQRIRAFNNWLDNVNGLDIRACFDIAHIHDNHAWPFATIAGGPLGPGYHRAGTAFKFVSGGDWNKCTNNFSYGYSRGTQIVDCNSMTLLSCSHDNTQVFAGSIAIEILGTSNDTRIIGCQGAAQATSIHVNTNAGNHTSVIGCDGWVNSEHGILVSGGDVTVIGGQQRNTPNGLTVTNAVSTVKINSWRTKAISVSPISLTVPTERVTYSDCEFSDLAAGTSPVAGTLAVTAVASAASVLLPANRELIVVTGTTNIGTIAGGAVKQRLTLRFSAALTMLHSTGASGIRLAGNVNFVVAAGSTLSLVFDGTQWYETSRAA